VQLKGLRTQIRSLFNTAKKTGEWDTYENVVIRYNKKIRKTKIFMEAVLPRDEESTRLTPNCEYHKLLKLSRNLVTEVTGLITEKCHLKKDFSFGLVNSLTCEKCRNNEKKKLPRVTYVDVTFNLK
jgi:hypothetical protein